MEGQKNISGSVIKASTRSSVRVFVNILSKEIISIVTTQNDENKFQSSNETVESAGEMALMMKLYMVALTISLTFEIYFFEFQWEKVSGVTLGHYL